MLLPLLLHLTVTEVVARAVRRATTAGSSRTEPLPRNDAEAMEEERQTRRTATVQTTGAVRPRLRGDVYFAAMPDGAFVRSTRGSLFLKGASVHRLLTALAPALTGAATLDELLAAVPDPQRPPVRQLVGTLLERGFVRDTGSDRPHTLGAAEAERYAGPVQFIDYFTDSAERRFQDFRAARLVCVCGPDAARGFLSALTDCGAGELTLVLPEADDVRTVRQFADALPEVPGQLAIVTAPGGAESAGWEALLRPADVVLHLADRPGADARGPVGACCARLEIPLVQGLVVGDAVWIWPACTPAADAPDADDNNGYLYGGVAWRRLLATRSDDERQALRAGPSPDELYRGPVPELAAIQLAFRAFCHLTGVAMPELAAMARLDTATLEIDHHPVLAPSGARDSGADDFRAEPAPARRVRLLRAAEPVPDPLFLERLTAACDRHLGPIPEVRERDYPQLPLFVTEARVADPGLRTAPRAVWGAAQTAHGARAHALRRAAATALELARQASPRPASESGWDLVTELARPLPVPGTGRYAHGIAAEADLDRSALAGILAALARLVPERATGGPAEAAAAGTAGEAAGEPAEGASAAPVPLAELAAADRNCVDLLTTTEARWAVHRIASPAAALPAYAFLLDGATVAVQVHPDARTALSAGLHDTLLAWQLAHHRAESGGPADTGGDPARELPSVQPRLATTDGVDQLAATLEQLRAAGLCAVLHVLDDDPALAELIRFGVRVVIGDA
ncbi:hypothetical protein [Streptomyces sp. WZ-12]|uniref:hypothetical protein n=1 Tax=Streptomyces sp. WZ-12 TaxID=3030210 RepID=UPI0023811ED5|nr:hypothetical protein [Streptomyces sp. WZ-12]